MAVRYFERVTVAGDKVALFRLKVDEVQREIVEDAWTDGTWTPTTRLVEYLFDGSTEIVEVNERDAMRDFPDALTSRVAKTITPTFTLKHLAGQHDQEAHGVGGGARELPAPATPKRGAPDKHPKATASTYDFTGKDKDRGKEVLDESFQEWRNSLSEEESKAIRAYTGSGYVKINKALRAGKPPSAESELIDKALQRAEMPADVIVTRGMLTLDKSVLSLRKGSVFHDNAFQSTSTEFGFAGNVRMRIHVPKGSKGAYLGKGKHSRRPDEGEVLLASGGTYKVLNRGMVEGYDTIDVQLISQGNPPPSKVKL
jgi:hypothetical protein